MSMMLRMAGTLGQRRKFDGLLDLYPGAAAAYSLRTLSDAFINQPIIRVRRSNDNAEADFTAEEISNGTLTTWTGANNGLVVTWYDQSGNNRHATQATAGNQPMIVSAGSLVTDGGRVAIHRHANTVLLTAGTVQLVHPTTGAWSAFGAVKYVNNAVDNIFANHDGFHRVAQMLKIQSVTNGGAQSIQFGNPTGIYSLISTAQNLANTRIIQTAISGQFDLNIFVNGEEMGSMSHPNPNKTISDRFDIFTRGSANTSSGRAYGQELIIYPSNQSANRTAIESNINAAWGVY